MIHRDLDQAIAGAFHERGNEAMHALERNERTDAFAAHRFQGAAGVADTVLRETAPDKIRDAAGDALHESVFALRAIAADKIGAALDLGEQLRNIGGIVLQIAVDQDGSRAARVF